MSRLTDRVLRGMNEALCCVEAGGTESLTGYDDTESRARYTDCLNALEWVRGEIERRYRAKAGKAGKASAQAKRKRGRGA